MATMIDDLMTEAEAAAVLKVKPTTLNSWRCLDRHGLPYIRIGRAIRYRRSDLDKWLRDRIVVSEDTNN